MKSNDEQVLSIDCLLDREKLHAWLTEWQADRLLFSDQSDESPVAVCSKPVNRSRGTVKAGHIYLLKPVCETLAARPRYVTALAMLGDERFLVVPFSRLGVPASPGELSTARTTVHLKVLCVWNARWMVAADIPEAWEAGRLNAEEQQNALLLYRHLRGEKVVLPKRIRECMGPVLIHPLDPRHSYIEEEREWIFRSLPGGTLNEEMRKKSLYVQSEPPVLKMAAEKRADYRARRQKK